MESINKAVLIDELFESDTLYFEAGAVCVEVEGAIIANMPGMENLVAGSVVQRIDMQIVSTDPEAWLDNIELQLKEMAIHRARIYIQSHNDIVSTTLLHRGYRPVDEVALLLHTSSRHIQDKSVSLMPILDQEGWDEGLSVYRCIEKGPDGHVSPPEQWIELERSKCNAGYMLPYLIYKNEDVCGAVNLAVHQHLVRLKNMVIHPDFRRKNCGASAAALFSDLAKQYGKSAAGCYAIENHSSLPMYKKAGYIPVAKQTEWLKEIDRG
jgi:GNAT superfamily N-acetyltransferase